MLYCKRYTFRLGNECQRSVDKVAKILEELVVLLGLQVRPREHGVGHLAGSAEEKQQLVRVKKKGLSTFIQTSLDTKDL